MIQSNKLIRRALRRKERPMEIKDMFSTEAGNTTNISSRALAGTARLTEQATTIMASVLRALEGRMDELGDKVKKSRENHDEMDALLSMVHDFNADDVQYLKDLGADELDKMLKSQQSKRSRAKSKQMTLDNYKNMMQGAIGELLIRQALGKEKSSGGAPTTVNGEYNAETLDKLAADQDALRKEIRNVQSKKSIAKSKAGFSESDPKWLLLLRQEEQLKSIRVDGATTPAKIVEVDRTRDELMKLLDGKDPRTMSKTQLMELLGQAQELASKPSTDKTNEEQA